MEEKKAEQLFFSINEKKEMVLKRGNYTEITLSEKEIETLSVILKGIYENN